MKIAVASDTLGGLPTIEGEYDLFVHCGNFCPVNYGDKEDIASQIEWLESMFRPWLSSIKAKHKIIVAGNTDFAVNFLDPNFEYHVDAIYLRNEAVTIDGLIVYGMPWISPDLELEIPASSCFIASTGEAYQSALNRIPDYVNLLITRVPPAGILDRLDGNSIGDDKLRDRIGNLNSLKMHFFGAAADDGGKNLYKNQRLFVNGCLKQTGYVCVDWS